MRDFLQNALLNRHRYKTHSEAVIVACFFNPQHSPYRLLTFQKWYHSIKHLNHRILECLIGEDTRSQLPSSPWITQVHTHSLLWHKETLLNKVIATLPSTYRYVFWVDTDVLFTNHDWLVDGVEALQTAQIIQPFEYCVHLDQNQLTPNFNVEAHRNAANHPTNRHPSMWRSFAATYAHRPHNAQHPNYDRHGHVGFAWGARREVLDRIPLYDRALIGGADHIIAHAAAGHIPHRCIVEAFPEQQTYITVWSRQFYEIVQGKIGYVPGDLYHLWHGDLAKRQYFSRIKGFEPHLTDVTRDSQGLWTLPRHSVYMRQYYQEREAFTPTSYDGFDTGFADDMGYQITDIPILFGAGYGTPGSETSMAINPLSSDSGGGGLVGSELTIPDAGGGADIPSFDVETREYSSSSDSGGGGMILSGNFS